MKTKRYQLILISILILILFIAPTVLNQKNGYMTTFLERNSYSVSNKIKELDLNKYEMKINQVACAYDKQNNTFYYPLSSNIKEGDVLDLNISFGLDYEQIYIDSTLIGELVSLKIKFIESYSIILKLDSHNEEFSLVFTRLPIVRITNKDNFNGTDSLSEITVIDPNYIKHGNDSMQIAANCLFSTRGSSSSAYKKNNFKFELVNDINDEISYSILGMRSDGDWILEGFYNDYSKMRKKIGMDIWMDISTVYYDENMVNGTHGEYVEVFINDKYNGFYLLSERIDKKLLDLSEASKSYNGGRIYKGTNYEFFVDEYYPPDSKSETWGTFECKYPKLSEVDYIDWEPIDRLYNLIYVADDETFIKDISTIIDYENVIEYYLYNNYLKAIDNFGNNMIWSVVDVEDEEKNKLLLSVWDLDLILGRDWKNEEENFDRILGNHLYFRLIRLNPDGFVELLQRKWATLKEGSLSYDNIVKRIEANYNILLSSGAIYRESNRWNSDLINDTTHGIIFAPVDVENEIEYMKKWIRSRMTYMDTEIMKLG